MPPPTEPQHAPIKAMIKINNGTTVPKLFRGSRVNPVVVTTTREGYGVLKHRFTSTNLPLGMLGSPSTPAAISTNAP